MAKSNGHTAPSRFGKFFRKHLREMMRIYDEAIHADFQEMIHHVSGNRPSSDLQKRLRKSLRQRLKPSPQPGCQNKSCLESSFVQWVLTYPPSPRRGRGPGWGGIVMLFSFQTRDR